MQRANRTGAGATPYLSINNIEVIYDHVILVLKGVSLTVPEGQDRRAAGRQRRRQEHDAEVDLDAAARRAGRSHQGIHRIPGRARRPADTERAGQERHVPGHGRPPLLRTPDGRGKPADRRLHPQVQPRRTARALETRLSLFPAPEDAPHQPVRLHLRRRAADDGHRPRADGQADHDPAGRAVDGPRAADRRGDLRDRAPTSTSRNASRSCWPSRTPWWRCATPTSATSSRTAAS